MRTGVLGGSFDPIHLGHLIIAVAARTALGLDRVLLVPAGRPPHKPRPMTPFRHRLAMARLAVAGWPELGVSDIEGRRLGPSYTIDTLAALARPGDELWFLVGADQYRLVDRWHRPEELTRHARLAVLSRPGVPRPPLACAHSPRRVRFLDVPAVDVSSMLVRARLARGEPVEYILPVPVLAYVRRHRLYRKPT